MTIKTNPKRFTGDIMSNPTLPTRREMVTAGTGIIAAMALAQTASAQSPTEAGMPDASLKMANPLEEFPKPPFKRQMQEWPGLVSKMDPRPDHGETSYRGAGKLFGRKALITGGDSGMGRAAAIAFAREGADVAIGYLPQEESDAQEVVELIRKAGRKAVTVPGDIREEAFCKKMVADAVAGLGGLDILVSNAARQTYQESILDISTEQLDATMKTNVYAMVWITQAALPHLQPGSTIIVTTSINAYDPSPGILDYAMTKGAGAIFIKALSKQLIKKGIRVNGVAPGPVWTPLQPSGGQSPEKLETFGKDVPMGRPGQPVELAPVYVLLASQQSSYTTGEIYGITGGHPTA
jgi:NAD(P)-dependent dehydrogenase (short-subunit alcohol dehydrogenase family)